MRRKKSSRVAIGCSIFAAACYGIVSYGHFYRGRMKSGSLFALLSIAHPVLALMDHFILNRKINRNIRHK